MERLRQVKEKTLKGALAVRNFVSPVRVTTFDEFSSVVKHNPNAVVVGTPTTGLTEMSPAPDGTFLGVRLETRMKNGRRVVFDKRLVERSLWTPAELRVRQGAEDELRQTATVNAMLEEFDSQGVQVVFRHAWLVTGADIDEMLDEAMVNGVRPFPFKE